MKNLILKSSWMALLLCAIIYANAQRPVAYDSPTREYNTAMELYQKGQYGAAQEYFQYVYEHTTDQQYDLKSNSYFYEGVCAANLNNANAAFLLKDFIRQYPIHSNVPDANFYLARYYFFKKQYKRALDNFEQIDERVIRTEDLAEYYFKKGYTHLAAGDRDEAKYLFRKAREYEGQYQQKAVYYLAHLAYEDGYYEVAKADFETLKDVKEYAKVVPFYITQIQFIEGDYEAVVQNAPALMAQSQDKGELNRIIALSYYNLGQYSEAAKHLDLCLKEETNNKKSANAAPFGRSDNYAAGYTYYKTKRYNDAVTYLAKVTDTVDAMAQNAYYIIGDCDIKMNEPRQAALSFLEASKMDFSAEVQEDAFYNYAKLQYQTSNGAFGNAVKALEEYIDRYPHSTRSAEATSYLATIYATTKRYDEAIRSIEKIDSKSPELLRSYQRCTHFRALEFIENKQYKNACKMIDKSMKYQMDPALQLQNLYWKAEAEYRDNNFNKAYTDFQAYHKATGVEKDPNYPVSFYSFGYSAMRNEKYKEGQQAFTKFLTFKEFQNDEVYQADAYARLGDCYFMQKNLNAAITNYEKCEKMKSINADYALYQASRCYGYQQKIAKKTELLERFANLYPKSNYVNEVKLELAETYHAQGQYDLAINSYKDFINKNPKSPYTPQAYNRLAQAFLNIQETENSISTFKKVVEKYPGSQDAKEALSSLESIYTEQGRTGDFFDYIRSKGINSITPERQDSIAYRAAYNKYEKGNCEMATTGFNDYINNFPRGYFAAEAHFYRAECAYGRNSYDEALEDYEYLISNYRTANNEVALKKAATILFNKENYSGALSYFNDLLVNSTNEINTAYAYNGIMRCAFELNNYKEALEGAKGYLSSETADQDLKESAQLIAGRSSFELRDYNAAKKYLKPLAKASNGDHSAEAAYYCALLEYKQGNYDECERVITEILEANYTSSYWLANTFILYGDFYAAKGNDFQARHTYQSIVDNYDGADLRDVAQQRIAKLDAKINKANSQNSNSRPEQDDEE